jgi:hypothetical protein
MDKRKRSFFTVNAGKLRVGAKSRLFDARNTISRLLDKRNFESKISYKRQKIARKVAIWRSLTGSKLEKGFHFQFRNC